jgi:hypothetical protein
MGAPVRRLVQLCFIVPHLAMCLKDRGTLILVGYCSFTMPLPGTCGECERSLGLQVAPGEDPWTIWQRMFSGKFPVIDGLPYCACVQAEQARGLG